MSEREGNALTEFFAPGVIPEDVPALFPLLAARNQIGALIALFRGGDDEVVVRLLVLREISLRADAPEWTPRELEHAFAYLAPAKLATVLGRLREHGLLNWDADRRVYQLSTTGRMVLAALTNLLAFSSEESGELGFYAAQIAAGQAVGKLSPEALAHLLARLTELEAEFTQAVASGSEFRLRAALTKLESVEKWMQKANEVMADLAKEGFTEDATWKLAQEIGQRQSRLMRMASVFQRELAAIARQQVHLSQGGLTSSELAGWLKNKSADELVHLVGDLLAEVPEPVFVLPDVMLDNTEEFIERERPGRKVSSLPPPSGFQETRETPHEVPPQLAALTRLLATQEAALPLTDAVVGENFAAASYRLSLLAFLGESNIDPELAPLAAVPFRVRLTPELTPIERGEVSAISTGQLVPVETDE